MFKNKNPEARPLSMLAAITDSTATPLRLLPTCLSTLQRKALTLAWVPVLGVSALSGALAVAQEMEEVIIQAESQEANTLDVTESIDVFDLEDLETFRITGLNDIANNVPGLTASPSGSQGLRFTLRGIGARDSQLGIESKIGLYVDGAYLGRASGLVFDIVDLEQVEVFKGPQGFTFGRHAIGGNINLITAKASVEDFYGKVEVTAGNYDRRALKTTVNLPVSETFALRASAFKNTREGWVENTGLGVDFGGFDREGFKVAARWFASDNVTVDYSYDNADFVTQPVYYQPEFVPGADALCRSDFDFISSNIALFGFDPTGPDCQQSRTILSPIGQGRVESDAATLKEVENSFTTADGHSLTIDWAWSESHNLKFIATHRSTDVNNTFYFFPNTADVNTLSDAIGNVNDSLIRGLTGNFLSTTEQFWYDAFGFQGLSLIGLAQAANTPEGDMFAQDLFNAAFNPSIYQEFNPGASLTCADSTSPGLCANATPQSFPNPFARQLAIFAIADTSLGQPGADYAILRRLNSLFSSPEGGLAALDNHKQFSFELRQEGYFLDDRLSYQTGLYYFNERTGNAPGNTPEGYIYGDIIEFLDFGDIDNDASSVDSFGFSYISINRLNTDSLGVYGSVEYTPLAFDERLHLTLGLRYSYDERELFRQRLQALTLTPRGTPDTETGVWESFDPMIKVAYDVSEEVTAYFSVAAGYRPGNFNVDARQLPTVADNIVGGTGGAGPSALDSGAELRFETESLIAYEFGSKGTLFDGLASMEFAMFFNDVKDGQETVIFPTSPVSRAVVNADGYTFGSELDMQWFLTDQLTLVTNYAHLRSGTDSYTTPFVPVFGPINAVDNPNEYRTLLSQCNSGLRTPDTANGRCVERKSNFGAPVNSWQLALDYKLPMDFGEFFFHLGYNFKDAHFVNDTLKVDARNLWDARISMQFEEDWGTYKVALWGQNLFDNEYQTQKFELNATVLDIASYGDPQMFGIDIIMEWF